MSKKTAPKKKPTVDHDTIIVNAFRRGQDERTAWYEKHIHEQFVEGPGGTKWLLSQVPEHIRQMETTASQAIRTHFERLTALESRSAPAKAWVPKVGDIAVLLPFREGGDSLASGVLIKGDAEPTRITFANRASDHQWYFRMEKHGKCDFPADRIRPATTAEIAEHKAKEEQRAKEAEWAKFDVLQPNDWCAHTRSEGHELQDMLRNLDPGRWSPSYETALDHGKRWVQWCPNYLTMGAPLQFFSEVPQGKEIPFAEFLRRLQGTITKHDITLP